MHKSKRKNKTRMEKYVLSVAVGTMILFVLMGASGKQGTQKIVIIPETETYHVHADFKVFMNGNEIDFSSSDYNVKDRKIHLHTDNDLGGNVIHVESEDATLGEFFVSLGMKFNSTCFVIEQEFCNTDTKTLKFYVNGERNSEYESYRPADLDRILVSYGDEDVQKQLDSITKLACVFSNQCPLTEDIKIVTL